MTIKDNLLESLSEETSDEKFTSLSSSFDLTDSISIDDLLSLFVILSSASSLSSLSSSSNVVLIWKFWLNWESFELGGVGSGVYSGCRPRFLLLVLIFGDVQKIKDLVDLRMREIGERLVEDIQSQ